MLNGSHEFLQASFQPVEVRLQVQDRTLDQEPGGGVRRVGFGLQLGQVTMFGDGYAWPKICSRASFSS